MMSRERELLERVRDTLRGLKETHYDLYWDIQTVLDLREDLREGISLRDHFAGLAMQSLLTKASITVGSDSVAMAAYHVAHQMLKERSRGEKRDDT